MPPSSTPTLRKWLLRKQTISYLEDWLTNCSTVSQIEIMCDDAGILRDETHQPNIASARRTVFRQHLATLDLSSGRDVQRLLTVFETALQMLDADIASSHAPEYHRATRDRMVRSLERDSFGYRDGHLVPLGSAASLEVLRDHAEAVDATYLHRQAGRLEDAIRDDPWLAIGTAKEIVETVCKTILTERGQAVDKKWDLMELVSNTRKLLRLTAADVPEHAKAAKTVKTLLNSLTTIVQGLAELRNTYGTGHGAEGRAKGLEPRHARLAAGAGVTLATFLFDTHAERTT